MGQSRCRDRKALAESSASRQAMTSTTTPVTPDPDAWVLDGGGEMGELIRATDWAATAFGPLRDWSRSLKPTVALLVHSRHPMFL